MSIFKCKMCGGTIEFEPGATVGVCDSCGTKQTLPRLDDDRRANLYDRANHFRRNNEFDKAAGLYEQILNEDPTDAEAYWSLVLCRYGIEYVEDPATHKRVPTVNRTQFTSIFDDEDYKSALQYADGYQRAIYEEEASAINEIQKGILAISQTEKPYDVFICYKETDDSGRRTPDSVLANDLYHQLTQEGFKVFFSRITLEDKLGSEYEPYIFAALNSAKVMVVLGTKPEYFRAVWVRNEWSRYLSLVKQSKGRKTLIPAYKDMDPYDLPDEFSHLMAQDMSKLGFMQDLIRGIKKIARVDEPKATVKETVVVGNAANVAPLLKRAFMFLEDGEWSRADDFCEQVLNQDPENAQAYLGKLMAELRVHRQADLADCEQPFDCSNNYQKAVRFGDSALSSALSGYIDHINERNENVRLTGIYNSAVSAMRSANSESAYKAAGTIFKTIPGFRDADTLAEKCLDRAEVCRKDAIYSSAKSQMTGERTDSYEAAITTFRTISGWKDTDKQIYACQRKIEEIKAREEANRLERERQAEQKRIAAEKAAKKRKRTIAIVTSILLACVTIVIVFVTVILPKQKLAKAQDLLDSGDYEAAYTLLEEIGNSDAIASSKYDRAVALIDSGDYEAAYALLEEIGNSDAIASSKYDRAVALIDSGDYEAAYALLEEIGNSDAIASSKYDRAVALIDSGDYEAAYILLNGLDYKDSASKRQMIEESDAWIRICPVGGIITFGSYEQDNNTSNGKEDIEWLVLEKEGERILLISRYALDCQLYNTSRTSVTWETCSLRKGLNGTFLSAAFSEEERAMIPNVTVSADKNPTFSTSPGNSTTDQVFLLSITEANKYFSSDKARKCAPTAYAIAQGAWTEDSNKVDGKATCYWWLRSPGYESNRAADVNRDGSVSNVGSGVSGGSYVYFDREGVRPALWVNLGS